MIIALEDSDKGRHNSENSSSKIVKMKMRIRTKKKNPIKTCKSKEEKNGSVLQTVTTQDSDLIQVRLT